MELLELADDTDSDVMSYFRRGDSSTIGA